MLSNMFQNICRIHNSEVVAIKLSSNKQLEDILMCVYCLTGNAQQPVVPINEIQKLYETKISFIKQLQAEKHQLINAYLSKIIDTLNQLKNDMNVQLDKGIRLIENQLEYENQRLQRQQNNHEDNEKTLNDYIQVIFSSEFSYSQQQQGEDEFSWIQYLSKELKRLSKIQEIQDCLMISNDLKKQYQIKDQNTQNQIKKLLQTISYNQVNERTPKLDFNCQIHGKEIILLDLNHETHKNKRLCCIECMPSQYISLSKAQEKWKQFETRRCNYLQQQILDKEQYYEQVQEQIIKIENQIIEQVKNLRINFEDNILVMKQKNVQSLNLNNYNLQNMNYTELQERIEIISKSEENQQSIIFQEYQEMQNSILSQLKEQLQQLQLYQQNLYDNLRSTLCNSQEISKETSQSDQQIHNINYFIIENRENSNSNQLEYLTQKSQESQDYKNSNEIYKEFNLQTLQVINENRQTRSASAQVKSKTQDKDQQIIEEKQIEHQYENNYELIERYQQEQNCHAISFNHDNKIMISGCQNDITVWEFNNGKIVKKQQLVGHTNLVISLFFCLSKTEFISGSTDKSIRYWQIVENQWTCTQILLGHKRQIDCLLFDNKGNQILSCSSDKSIRVWRKNEQLKWIQVQVLTNHQAYVRCISFSKSEGMFVLMIQEIIIWIQIKNMIIVWEIDEFKEWKLKQTISNDDYGYRICFVEDNMLIWQPRNINQSIIFQWNSNLNQFDQSNQNIQLLQQSNGYQNFFPSIYNEDKQIVINKHGRYVYVLKKLINDQLLISQVIEVGHYCNYGALSPNGEYLVIWDEGSKYFQIRKAKF